MPILEQAMEREQVSLGAILKAVGRRSFGPFLLVAGLITLAPIIGDIPGIPTIMGMLVLLTAGQLLFRRKHFWLPRWLLKRSVEQNKLHKALKWLRPPSQFIDRLLRPRLTMLIQDVGIYVIAIACDAFADPLTADIQGGSVRSTSTVTIPEPSSLPLLGIGLLGLGRFRGKWVQQA